MNFVTILALIVSSTLVYSAPLIFAALGGTFSENSGIVNVGLEGIMTMGAFTAVVFNLSCASTFGAATPWLGALLGGADLLPPPRCGHHQLPGRPRYLWYGFEPDGTTTSRLLG